MPADCSWLAIVISAMMLLTRATLATTSDIVVPACAASLAPASTRLTESSISVLISLAALALRWARPRTSVATTAKPRPCSPARAASTAAFRARILVWKAMPSMTLMMSTILRDDSLIRSMVPITCPTTAPPLLATSDAVVASTFASRALSAFLRTVLVSSSIEEAVSSSELACCSVRVERSLLPVEISSAARATVSESWRTEETTEVSDTCMRCSADSTLALSFAATLSFPVRSPPASRLTASHSWRGSAPSALSKWRVMSQPARDASAMDSTLAPMRMFRLSR